MPDHDVAEPVTRLGGRLASRRTRRWALGSLLAAVAAGTTRAGVAAHKPGHDSVKELHSDLLEKGDAISIDDMFEMQLAMNRLAQLSEQRPHGFDAEK